MDVCGIFSTDAVYNSMRSSYFRDYEQFPYGTLENYKSPIQKDPYSKVQGNNISLTKKVRFLLQTRCAQKFH